MSTSWTQVLTPEMQAFISSSEAEDVADLSLRKTDFLGVPFQIVAQQIVGRQLAKGKLPSWYRQSNIIYPPRLSLEQCSSEQTAAFRLSGMEPGRLAVDLTGGFGVDSYYLARKFDRVLMVEPDAELARIVEHNYSMLGITNVEIVSERAENFLATFSGTSDLMYVDPSRRLAGRRVFRLQDCQPNLTELYPAMIQATHSLMVKASPLLDIKDGLRILHCTSEVQVVAVANECRELVFKSSGNGEGIDPVIRAIELSDPSGSWEITISEEERAKVTFGPASKFVYEPHAALLKAGAFKSIADRLGLQKLHPSTHLYTSEDLRRFPGRIFELTEKFVQGKNQRANLVTRNYPLTPEQLKAKYNIKDGGDQYLLGFTDQMGKQLWWANRLK